MTKLNDLQSLFIHELKDLLSAEHQLAKALPKLAKMATNGDLQAALQQDVEGAKSQIDRLEMALADMDKKPGGVKCVAMEGLIDECQELLGQAGVPAIVDAALICAVQRIKHYEIAGYGCARSLARQLALEEFAAQLQAILDEEKETDTRLSQLAQEHVNQEAMALAE
jgi:ferritin-like metal-binding protein YciE